jgi:transcriptional antiterminator
MAQPYIYPTLTQQDNLNQPSASSAQLTDEQLLDLYLRLTKAQCEQQFADTAQVARMCKVSRRTVQLWVTNEQIRAVPVGPRKWQVWLPSLRGHLKHACGSG